jgi:uncharacterized membrane protein
MNPLWVLIGGVRNHGSGKTEESLERALKRRYANGEVNLKTYERRLQELRK